MPLQSWLLGPLRDWSREVLLESCPMVLDEQGVDRLLAGLGDLRPYFTEYLWRLLALAVWSRKQQSTWSIEVLVRLLVLIDSLVPDGAERQMALTVTNLPKEWEVRCFSPGGWSIRRLPARPRNPTWRSPSGAGNTIRCPYCASGAPSYGWRPHLVHSWGYLTTLAGFPIYRALGIPFIDGYDQNR